MEGRNDETMKPREQNETNNTSCKIIFVIWVMFSAWCVRPHEKFLLLFHFVLICFFEQFPFVLMP